MPGRRSPSRVRGRSLREAHGRRSAWAGDWRSSRARGEHGDGEERPAQNAERVHRDADERLPTLHDEDDPAEDDPQAPERERGAEEHHGEAEPGGVREADPEQRSSDEDVKGRAPHGEEEGVAGQPDRDLTERHRLDEDGLQGARELLLSDAVGEPGARRADHVRDRDADEREGEIGRSVAQVSIVSDAERAGDEVVDEEVRDPEEKVEDEGEPVRPSCSRTRER